MLIDQFESEASFNARLGLKPRWIAIAPEKIAAASDGLQAGAGQSASR